MQWTVNVAPVDVEEREDREIDLGRCRELYESNGRTRGKDSRAWSSSGYPAEIGSESLDERKEYRGRYVVREECERR